jgi:hypothetical protein
MFVANNANPGVDFGSGRVYSVPNLNGKTGLLESLYMQQQRQQRQGYWNNYYGYNNYNNYNSYNRYYPQQQQRQNYNYNNNFFNNPMAMLAMMFAMS